MYDPKLMPGTNHCKCPTCGEYFTTPKNFDIHRSGKATARFCKEPGSLVDKHGKVRLRRNAKGLWAGANGVYLPRGRVSDG